MRLWKKWWGLHPVQRWALRVTGWTVALHFLPLQPYIPACLDEASIFHPPRLRAEALVETSDAMSHSWWRHVVFAGRIWMPPFQTSDLNGHWWGWQSNSERLIVAQIASSRLSNGTQIEVPAALTRAIEAWRADAQARRPFDDNPFLQEYTRFSNCNIQRAAFLPD
ncbi:MAG: hypothetical protein H7345_07790 [Rubritepida sp.]|nr:hypothetical protein [Rubritepida sp.]